MLCPDCQEEMKNGYLQSSMSLVWSSVELSGIILPREEGDFQVTTGMFKHIIESKYCAHCKILVSFLATNSKELNSSK